ncbi:MAG TPA: hypothetical protein VKZ49_00010 [Polyangiaceae bacterium]|nr:hypothetical protein [Polyangiaceae bacterium]
MAVAARTWVQSGPGTGSSGCRVGRPSGGVWLLLIAGLSGCASGAASPEPGAPPAATETDGGCDYRVDGRCYTDRDEACRAAGCDLNRCMILESYPMQIRCH